MEGGVEAKGCNLQDSLSPKPFKAHQAANMGHGSQAMLTVSVLFICEMSTLTTSKLHCLHDSRVVIININYPKPQIVVSISFSIIPI